MYIPYFMSYIIIHHKDILSSQKRHQTMKCFDAGTKKMSVPSFGSFIKLMPRQLPNTGSWVLPRDRSWASLRSWLVSNSGRSRLLSFCRPWISNFLCSEADSWKLSSFRFFLSGSALQSGHTSIGKFSVFDSRFIFFNTRNLIFIVVHL